MALGPSEFTVDSWLNALFNATSFSVAGVWIKLHTADPGAAGTASPCTETTRKSVSMGTPAAPSSGVITISNDAQVQYTSIAATGAEDATHYSLWDTVGPAGGNFLGSGVVTANAFSTGDTLTFAIGDIDISLTAAF